MVADVEENCREIEESLELASLDSLKGESIVEESRMDGIDGA